MIDSVEELLQIKIDHKALAGPHILLRGSHRLMCVAAWAKAVARLGKSGLEDRLQNLQQCLLNQPIHQRRYPEQSHPARGLRDLNCAYRLRDVPTYQQSCLHCRPMLLQPVFELGYR